MGVKASSTTICHPLFFTLSNSLQFRSANALCPVAKAGLFRQDSSNVCVGFESEMSVEDDHSESEGERKGWGWMTLGTTLSSGPLSVPLYRPFSFNERWSLLQVDPRHQAAALWSSSHESLPFSRELWILSRVFLMRSAVSLAEGFWYQHSFISFTRADRVWEKQRTGNKKGSHAVKHPQWGNPMRVFWVLAGY